MKSFLTALAIVLSMTSVAHADLDKLCDQVNQWTPGQPGPAAEEYKGEMTVVDYDFYKKHKNLKNWLLVDARGDTERTEKGYFEEVLSLRSGLKEGDADDFNETAMLEKMKTHTKRKNLKAKDLKSYNYILFCNGEKCPKSALAGCKLRKMGVAASRVNLLPLSYTDLKAKGL
jgi:hypothetical protein